MAEEIREAVQILQVAFEGIAVLMKVGSGGLKALKESASFIAGMLEHEKLCGKTDMKNLLKKGGDMQVLRFQTKDMKKVQKLAKKYGILYSAIPNADRTTNMSEIIFHTEAVPRVNMLLEKIKSGSILNYDEFLAKKDENQVDKLLDFLKKSNGKNTKATDITMPTKEQQELADSIKATSLAKNTGMKDITMSKSLIMDEDNLSVKVRVPGTWGKDVRYIWMERENIVDVHDGKSMLTFLENDKKYNLLDKNNKLVNSITGNELQKHYDEVKETVRKNAGVPRKNTVPGKTRTPKTVKTGR